MIVLPVMTGSPFRLPAPYIGLYVMPLFLDFIWHCRVLSGIYPRLFLERTRRERAGSNGLEPCRDQLCIKSFW